MSLLFRSHPSVVLVYFAALLGFIMFTVNPILHVIALAGGVLLSFALIKRKELLADVAFYVPFFLLVTLTNPLFSHNGKTPLFFMNGNAITLEAIAFGAGLGLMLVTIMVWCKCLSLVFSTDKVIFLFGTVLPQLSLVISMTVRFLPLLKRRAAKVSRAQKAMGLYSQKSYFDRCRSAVSVASVLIGWSLEHAVETSNSMKARGYGLKGRSHYSVYSMKKNDLFVLFVIFVLSAIVICGLASGVAEFGYYPGITVAPLSGSGVLMYVGLGLYSVLPLIAEVWEIIRWKYCRSKI